MCIKKRKINDKLIEEFTLLHHVHTQDTMTNDHITYNKILKVKEVFQVLKNNSMTKYPKLNFITHQYLVLIIISQFYLCHSQ